MGLPDVPDVDDLPSREDIVGAVAVAMKEKNLPYTRWKDVYPYLEKWKGVQRHARDVGSAAAVRSSWYFLRCDDFTWNPTTDPERRPEYVLGEAGVGNRDNLYWVLEMVDRFHKDREMRARG